MFLDSSVTYVPGLYPSSGLTRTAADAVLQGILMLRPPSKVTSINGRARPAAQQNLFR
jgi:hypothetical protein